MNAAGSDGISTTNQIVDMAVMYRLSWINRLASSLMRSRLSYWVTCLLLLAGEFLLIQTISWLDGSTRFPTLQIVFINPPLWTFGSLGLIIHLDRISIESLRKFRPLLDVTDQEYLSLEFRLSNMPTRPIILVNICFVLFFLVFVFAIPIKALELFRGRGFYLLVGSAVISFLFGSAFYYHTIHQLRLIDRLYQLALPFDLFDREPIFAFSKVTSQTSVALTLFLASNLVVALPLRAIDLGVVVFELIGIPLALAAFITPLWGAHTRLINQKRHLQSQAEARMKQILLQLESSLRSENLPQIDSLHKALAAQVIERDVLTKLPTWPWRPGTITGVGTALLIPTLLLLLQAFIQRMVLP